MTRRSLEWLSNFLPSRIHEYICDIDGIQLLIASNRKDDLLRTVRTKNLNSMEQGSLLLWKKLASQSNLVLDIGAYTGIYSMTASRSGSKVIAFEPNESIRSFLYRNLRSNECSNVTVHHFALSSRNSTERILAPKLKFSIQPKSTSSGVQLETANSNRDLTKWQSVGEVLTRTLDEVLTETEMTEVGITKIDVEGAEIDVLLGATKFLNATNSFMLIECFDYLQFSKVNEILSTYNYSLLEIYGVNYLFGKSQIPLN